MAESLAASAIRLHLPPMIPPSSSDFHTKRLAFRTIRATVAKELTMEVANSSPLFPPRNRADDPSLQNPLLRQHRMGCGWLTAILELDGVVLEDDPEIEHDAWLTLSHEESRPPPTSISLRRAEGMKNEQALSDVFLWSRNTSDLRRLASRKEEIHRSLRGPHRRLRPGSFEFLTYLLNHKIPLAIASTRPRSSLEESLDSAGLRGFFDAAVTADDVSRGKPDPEMFLYASQVMGFIPERCVVFGNSNSTVDAAHTAGMKCVAVASKHPVYELSAADLVVRHLDELSVVDLKNLADIEMPEFDLQTEEEAEAEAAQLRSPSVSRWDPYR